MPSPFLHGCGRALRLKRMTVGALSNGGIFLVRYDLDLVKRAIVLVHTMMLALVYGALDTHVSVMVVLHDFPFLSVRVNLQRNIRQPPHIQYVPDVWVLF